MNQTLAFLIVCVALALSILAVRWIARRLPRTRPGRNVKRAGMGVALIALPVLVAASSIFWIGEVFEHNYQTSEPENLGEVLTGLIALPLEVIVIFMVYMFTIGSVVVALTLILLIITAWICWESLPDPKTELDQQADPKTDIDRSPTEEEEAG